VVGNGRWVVKHHLLMIEERLGRQDMCGIVLGHADLKVGLVQAEYTEFMSLRVRCRDAHNSIMLRRLVHPRVQ
jgi:hypothetical protein